MAQVQKLRSIFMKYNTIRKTALLAEISDLYNEIIEDSISHNKIAELKYMIDIDTRILERMENYEYSYR